MNNPITTCDDLKLAALKEAIQIGIDDMEAGRFITFDTAEALDHYLSALADEILGGEIAPPHWENTP